MPYSNVTCSDCAKLLGVTSIETCTPCLTAETHKKGTFIMVSHDTCVSHLGYRTGAVHQKHENHKKG